MKIVYLLLFGLLLAHPQADKVYICYSTGAYAYHCKKNCDGLSSCRREIKEVNVELAEKLGKTQRCKVCYY